MADFVPITNLRGPAARITGVSVATVPADVPADVTMTGPDQNRQFVFKIPRGLPGVNAVENDTAMATHIAAEDSVTHGALLPVVDARLTPAQRRAALFDLGAADRLASTAGRQVDWGDNAAFTEGWANLSAWSSATFGVVSGGRLFSDAQGGSSGANHVFQVAAGETGRAVFQVRTVGATTSGGVIVGVSSDAPGGAFTTGAATTRGLYWNANGWCTMTNGSAGSNIGASPNGAGTSVDFVVVITVNPDWITATARSFDGLYEVRYRWARSGTTVNNIVVFNSDSRKLAGSSVGPVGARKTMSTVTPSAGVEGAGAWCVWTSSSGVGMRIGVPASYDSRKPAPLAILCHGNGSDELHFATNTNGKAVADALLAAGYIVASAAWSAAVSTWGSSNAITTYTALYQAVRDRYNIGPVVIYGNSMGSIEALNLLARDTIPGVHAYACTVPTYDLANNHANASFTSTIDAAYGGDYATNSVGHDPALMDPRAFRGIPVWMLVATDDAAINPTANGAAMYTALSKTNSVTRINVTGGHSTSQIAANAATIAAFFNTVLGR